MADYDLEWQDPAQFETLEQFLFEAMRLARIGGGEEYRKDSLLDILAARMALNVVPNNKSALEARLLRGAPDIKKVKEDIAEEKLKLMNSDMMKNYFAARSSQKLISLVSSGGHGGKLERDLTSFVRTKQGPIDVDTPKRYRPTALQRIDALKKQLGKLQKTDPNYAKRAREICAEIAATRSAVNSIPGSKSSLKHTYDPKVMKKHYDAIHKALEHVNVDDLVKDGLKFGHGGKMEARIKQAVRNHMAATGELTDGMPARYQVTYQERMEYLRQSVTANTETLKKNGALSPKERNQMKLRMAEMVALKNMWDSAARTENLSPEQKKALTIDSARAGSWGGVPRYDQDPFDQSRHGQPDQQNGVRRGRAGRAERGAGVGQFCRVAEESHHKGKRGIPSKEEAPAGADGETEGTVCQERQGSRPEAPRRQWAPQAEGGGADEGFDDGFKNRHQDRRQLHEKRRGYPWTPRDL